MKRGKKLASTAINKSYQNNSYDEDDEVDETHLFLDSEQQNQDILVHKKRLASKNKFYGVTESHQYEQDENEVLKYHQKQRHLEDVGHWWTFAKRRDVRRWLLTLITGFLCGLVALFVTFFTKIITKAKLSMFTVILDKEKNGDLTYGTAFLFLLVINLVFAATAWYAVYIEPLAAGSGIPEVKCFLNGLNIPRIVRVKTLICKALGTIFSCSASLPIGKEGPMVHAGSVIAAGISQGKSNTLGFDTHFSKYQDFRNDKEKRDFVACGAAAGVAAAFGSPIGGVLFSLEEGASFWSTRLTWRCFFCAMTTVFTVYLINSASTLFGHSDSTAMFSFGEFFSLEGEESNYSVWELSLFIIIGCMGGVIGALFNYVNTRIFNFREMYTRTPRLRLIEVLVLTAVYTILAYFLPLLWSKCTALPVDMEEWSDQEKTLVELLVPLYCDSDSEYNELASLYLTDSDTAIKQLFHFREIGDHNDSTFSSAALFLFFMPYILLACLTCGSAVPAGMFVPSLLSGAAFGRLIGHLLHKLDMSRGTFADSGTYALMGAAAITGGITRMTISLTVMILEATGDMQYVLPLMLVVMSARLVGNIFNEGLYDIHIKTHNLAYLDEDESISHLPDLHDLKVNDIMSKNPIVLHQVLRVGDVYDILKRSKHHCYPITDESDSSMQPLLCGIITRKVICTLIKNKAFGAPTTDVTSSKRLSPLIPWDKLECIYPRYPDIEQLSITELERCSIIDLRPYIDFAPYSINEKSSVQRAYRMFRTLGLRHLCVTNKYNRVLGILTRADFMYAHSLSDPSEFSFHSKNMYKSKERTSDDTKSLEKEKIIESSKNLSVQNIELYDDL